MKNIKLSFGGTLSSPFKTNELRMILSFIILFIITSISSCAKKDSAEGSESHTGVWQRYGSPKGYNTDLAIGNIPGEPANRVYMCEHPGSPSAGLYKGYITGNTIKWDAAYGLPDAEFNEVGSERTLYFGVGAVSDAGKYKKGIWTNTCGPLKYVAKNIYYRWTNGSTCTIPSDYTFTYKHADLPSRPTKGQLYGPISGGTFEIIINSTGSSPTSNYVTLPEPPSGYRRTYTHNVFQYDNSVNRCLFHFNVPSSLTYVDEKL